MILSKTCLWVLGALSLNLCASGSREFTALHYSAIVCQEDSVKDNNLLYTDFVDSEEAVVKLVSVEVGGKSYQQRPCSDQMHTLAEGLDRELVRKIKARLPQITANFSFESLMRVVSGFAHTRCSEAVLPNFLWGREGGCLAFSTSDPDVEGVYLRENEARCVKKGCPYKADRSLVSATPPLYAMIFAGMQYPYPKHDMPGKMGLSCVLDILASISDKGTLVERASLAALNLRVLGLADRIAQMSVVYGPQSLLTIDIKSGGDSGYSGGAVTFELAHPNRKIENSLPLKMRLIPPGQLDQEKEKDSFPAALLARYMATILGLVVFEPQRCLEVPSQVLFYVNNMPNSVFLQESLEDVDAYLQGFTDRIEGFFQYQVPDMLQMFDGEHYVAHLMISMWVYELERRGGFDFCSVKGICDLNLHPFLVFSDFIHKRIMPCITRRDKSEEVRAKMFVATALMDIYREERSKHGQHKALHNTLSRAFNSQLNSSWGTCATPLSLIKAYPEGCSDSEAFDINAKRLEFLAQYGSFVEEEDVAVAGLAAVLSVAQYYRHQKSEDLVALKNPDEASVLSLVQVALGALGVEAESSTTAGELSDLICVAGLPLSAVAQKMAEYMD